MGMPWLTNICFDDFDDVFKNAFHMFLIGAWCKTTQQCAMMELLASLPKHTHLEAMNHHQWVSNSVGS